MKTRREVQADQVLSELIATLGSSSTTEPTRFRDLALTLERCSITNIKALLAELRAGDELTLPDRVGFVRLLRARLAGASTAELAELISEVGLFQ